MKRYDYLCEGVAVVTTISQTQQVFQIASLILTCLATLFSICFTIYNWYKKASEDKKISVDEVQEINEKIKEGVDSIQNVINKGKK